MGEKTIKDLKTKLIEAIYGIDTSKITLVDLKTVAEIVSVLALINDKPFDYTDVFSKISSMGLGLNSTTLCDLKESE